MAFNASIHVTDGQDQRLIIKNAKITGPTVTNVTQPRPGFYGLTFSAPGSVKVCAPDYFCNGIYIYELDEYWIGLKSKLLR